MEYEKIDEATRYKNACENVKKIVNAIKMLKIKYYLDFSRISKEDEEMLKRLESDLDRVSEENNLNSLKAELIGEVDAKYEKRGQSDEGDKPKFVDDKLMACYGVIDVQQNELSKGKIKKAIKCQKLLSEYMKEIQSQDCRDMIITYKRRKLGELNRSAEIVHENNEQWMEKLKSFNRIELAMARGTAIEVIQGTRREETKTPDKIKEEIEIS